MTRMHAALTKRMLTNFGADPEVAQGAEQAFLLLEKFDPQVLISDLGMPTLDGFQLIRQVRARGYTFQRLPAIALTAFASSSRPTERRCNRVFSCT